MRVLPLVGWILAAALVALPGCTTESIQAIDGGRIAPAPDRDLSEIGGTIEALSVEQGWDIRTVRSGKIMAAYFWRRHVARVVIEYDLEEFRITYIGGNNLDAKSGTIHKGYNKRVRRLAAALRKRLGTMP